MTKNLAESHVDSFLNTTSQKSEQYRHQLNRMIDTLDAMVYQDSGVTRTHDDMSHGTLFTFADNSAIKIDYFGTVTTYPRESN